jgi:hypothetical protein
MNNIKITTNEPEMAGITHAKTTLSVNMHPNV